MTESAQRRAWQEYDSNEDAMIEIAFGPDRLKVARPTIDAWRALEAVIAAHDYQIRSDDTHGYFPRNIAGKNVRSLHAFGIAIDVNATTNPMRKTPNKRVVRFSDKLSQHERGDDVRNGHADTDMTPAMIADVKRITTEGGRRLFGWGGDWVNSKDPMHFYVDVSPRELATGVDFSTVEGEDYRWDFSDDDHALDHGHDHHDPADDDGEDGNGDRGDQSMLDMPEVQRFRPLLDFIAKCEGTANRSNDGYDTSLGYGAYSGGEHELTQMTLAQIDALQGRMLAHPKNNFNSSALGRYQIVRKTLRALKARLGLSPSQLYSRDLQDRLAVQLIKGRGRSVQGLRNEWQSLTKKSGAEIIAKYDEIGHATDFSDRRRVAPVDPIFSDQMTQADWIELLLQRIEQARSGQMQVASKLLFKPSDRGDNVVALQKLLTARNYNVGTIDGIYGTLTRGAVASFQADYNIFTDVPGTVDEATWDALQNPLSRPLSAERVNTTASDLRVAGSTTIKNADRTRLIGWLAGVLGTAGLGKSAYSLGEGASQTQPGASAEAAKTLRDLLANTNPTDLTTILALKPPKPILNPQQLQDLINAARTAIFEVPKPAVTAPSMTLDYVLGSIVPTVFNSLVPGFGGSLAALGIGVAAHLFGSNIISKRVENQRNGRYIGPIT